MLLQMPSEIVKNFGLRFDREFRDEFYANCEAIFDDAFLTDHRYVRLFEEEFQRFTRIPHAIGVNSGTGAIEAALLAINVQGKEVYLPSNTFIATAAAIERAGGIPVPLDIEPEWFGLSPKALASRARANGGAVIQVHIGGLISPHIHEIMQVCSKLGLALIEDCAHAHGSSLEGRPAGEFGLAGCFSFFPTKTVTAGEGGMVVTSDSEFAGTLQSVRRFGRDSQDPLLHVRAGSNFKMTEFQALLGLLDLKRSGPRLQKRRELAARYESNLKGSSWRPLAPASGGESGYYKQILLSPLPWREVHEKLSASGVEAGGGVYFHPLHKQPYYSQKLSGQSFPESDRFSDFHICPPIYPELTFQEVDHVCEILLRIHD